jgi:hypothetical protein
MAKKQSKPSAKSRSKQQNKKVVNSHDAFFKSTFSYKEVAQSAKLYG